MERIRTLLRALREISGERNLARMACLVVSRCLWFLLRKCVGPKSFVLNGEKVAYRIDPRILNTERIVEIGLATATIEKRCDGSWLEIGNVLSNYLRSRHDIVDKYEHAPGVQNEDIVAFNPGKRYDLVVSLSTLEHVGFDEPEIEPEKILHAIKHIKENLLAPGGIFLATVPIGHNPHLDKYLNEERWGFSETFYMKRTAAWGTWRQVDREEAMRSTYGQPYACANAIAIGMTMLETRSTQVNTHNLPSDRAV
ncbi:MAG: hypothetical protein O3C57_05930 [Verrucomicrobia bacterium]|nr:hypothetical protein [Verrucomicrobiota bacterium]